MDFFAGLLGLLVVAFLVVGGATARALLLILEEIRGCHEILQRFTGRPQVSLEPLETELADLRERVRDIPIEIKELKLEVESDLRKSRAAEARARGLVRRAREELEEGGYVGDAGEELLELNADGGGDEGVPAVRTGLEASPAVDPRTLSAREQIEYARRRKLGG